MMNDGHQILFKDVLHEFENVHIMYISRIMFEPHYVKFIFVNFVHSLAVCLFDTFDT